MPVTHTFTSAKSDGADATLVRPSNWNAAHTIDDILLSKGTIAGANAGQLGIKTTDGSTAYVGIQGTSWNALGLWAPGATLTASPQIGISTGTILLGLPISEYSQPIRFNPRGDVAQGMLITSGGAGLPTVDIKAFAAQTQPLLRMLNSSNAVLLAIDQTGKITTAQTEAVLEETGDALGTVRLRLQCRTGLTGALFENAAVDLVDFAFKPSIAATGYFRYEGRGAYSLGTGGPEFQIGTTGGGAIGNTPLYVGQNSRTVAQSTGTGIVPFTVRGIAAQTANLQEWVDSTPTVLAKVDSAGAITHKTNKAVLDTDHTGLADPHTVYILESLFTGKGSIITASAASTPSTLLVGADDTILMADAAAAGGLKWVASATPSTQAFGDAATVGTADTFTRGDHKHAMPADPVTNHAAAADPHTGYRLESADHTHASTGIQAGQVAHSALTGLTNDEHTQYQKESEKAVANGYASLGADILVPQDQLGTGTQDGTKFLRDDGTWQTVSTSGGIQASIVDVKGDIIVASAADTVVRKAAGADDTILMADAAQADGLKWVASAAPAAETFGAAQTIGTTDTFSRGDHVHAMPADPVTSHAAAGDPHTGYRLESADHTHASTGIQAGTVAHSALTGLTNDEHTQYVLEATAGISGTLALTADITDTSVGAINDWAPTGLATASVIRWNGVSVMTLSGITGGADGRVLVLQNVTAAQNLQLTHDSLSTAANRFYLPHAVTPHNVGPNESVTLVYDATVSRWRTTGRSAQAQDIPVATTGASSNSGSTTSKLSSFDHQHPLGTVSFPSTVALGNIITDTSVGALNDWAPTGIATANAIRWNGASAATLSGITTGASGRVLVLMNVATATANTLTLVHDLTSTTNNRFYIPSATNYVIPRYGSVLLVYDAAVARWRVMEGVMLTNTLPTPDGTASAGSALEAARYDHVHAYTPQSIDFSKGGSLTVGAGTFRWYNRSGRTLTFDSVTASVGTAPTGASIIIDVTKGGTTIYTTQANRPTIAVSTNTIDDTTAPNITTIADNEYITIDIDQVGSTVAGADLTVQVWLRG